jgi:hypothetical protein
MDVQSESAAGNWERKQENCEPHVSKESHTFLTNNISFRALKAIAIRYHTPLSGHAIFLFSDFSGLLQSLGFVHCIGQLEIPGCGHSAKMTENVR